MKPRHPHNIMVKITNTVIQKDHYNYNYQNSGSKKYGVSMWKVYYINWYCSKSINVTDSIIKMFTIHTMFYQEYLILAIADY